MHSTEASSPGDGSWHCFSPGGAELAWSGDFPFPEPRGWAEVAHLQHAGSGIYRVSTSSTSGKSQVCRWPSARDAFYRFCCCRAHPCTSPAWRGACLGALLGHIRHFQISPKIFHFKGKVTLTVHFLEVTVRSSDSHGEIISWTLTTLWKFRLRRSSLHPRCTRQGKLHSTMVEKRATKLAFGRGPRNTPYALVHRNEEDAQVTHAELVLEPEVPILDGRSQPLLWPLEGHPCVGFWASALPKGCAALQHKTR